MEQTDLEKLIGELELAVDRLRSLYEQYFVGIEKIEPAVPRKDVDRRIYALRKEQIRNTAMRFRFQMVLQRYNTYQTHWQRICREIENGTYKRHMIRAQRRFGTVRPPRGRSSAPPPPGPGAELAPDVASQLLELDPDFAVPAFPGTSALASPRPPSRVGPLPPPFLAAAPSAPSPLSPKAPRSGAPPAALVAGPGPSAPMWKKKLVSPTATAPTAAAAPPERLTAPEPRPVEPRPTVTAPLSPKQAAPEPPPPPRQAVPEARPDPLKSPRAPVAADLPEARLRKLYSDLVETKRRQNESTAAITYQSVAKSILESSERLRKKHGREVDFEVMIKDGKAVLRPVLK